MTVAFRYLVVVMSKAQRHSLVVVANTLDANTEKERNRFPVYTTRPVPWTKPYDTSTVVTTSAVIGLVISLNSRAALRSPSLESYR